MTIFQGTSGSSFDLQVDVLTKIDHNKKRARISYDLQLEAYESDLMYPLKVCRPISFNDGEFRMEYIEGSKLTTLDSLVAVKKIIKYFDRDYERKSGFKELMTNLSTNYNNGQKIEIKRLLREVGDEYITGFTHGDFHSGNFIVRDDDAYLIDFSQNNFNTPLYDVCKLLASYFRHRDFLAKEIRRIFKKDLGQLKILCLVYLLNHNVGFYFIKRTLESFDE